LRLIDPFRMTHPVPCDRRRRVAARRLTVDLPHQRIHAAIDGEPVVLEPPLELEIRPRGLRVLVPPRPG